MGCRRAHHCCIRAFQLHAGLLRGGAIVKATLTYFEHYCAGLHGCDDIVSTVKSVSLIRKYMLRVDGKIKFMGTHAKALEFAVAHGYEVQE